MLEEHRRLVRDAVESRAGGMEIDCRGDEMLLVFADAGDAVRGAVEAQRALAAHAWPEGERGARAHGPAHGRAVGRGLDATSASTSTASHGSATPATAGRCCSPSGRTSSPAARRADLGSQPFKGLPEPERIYQVLADGLREDFPPLRLDPRQRERPAGVERRRHAGRRRRGLRAPARGDRAAARGRRARGRRPGRQRRRADAEGALVQAERGDRRHPDAADADRRGPARGEGDPREASRDERARALPVPRAGLRARAALRERRGRRLPAQGPRRRRPRVRRRRQARRRGRLGARPVGRLAARRPPPRGRPDRRS